MANRPAPPTRKGYPEFYPLQTRWADCDIYGHLNNTVHYALFDTAVNGWLIAQGLLDPASSPELGVVAESSCKYFAEIHFPDALSAGIRIDKIGQSSVSYNIALFRDGSDKAAAQGHFVHVYVDRTTRRPVPIRKAHRRILERLISSHCAT
jgi:acyl-CoA thioester hydrolase